MLTVLVVFLVGAAAFAVAGLVSAARERLKKHGPHKLAWRWLTGMPHHGKALTDAGWSRPGTKAHSGTEHVRRFWYLPRWRRAARRASWTLTALLLLAGLVTQTVATLLALAVTALAGAAYGLWRARRWWLTWKHTRMWVYPAHLAAAELAGIAVAADPLSWLAVEPDRSRVVAELPRSYNADDKQRQRLAQMLTAKLGLDNHEVRWQLAGPKPRLELTRSVPPPSFVSLEDALPAITAAKPDEVVWGLGRKNTAVKTSLSGDSPHVGINAGSGGGKSVTARSFLAQVLHKGGIGLILDNKMISHQWADGLPNVVIARRAPELHAAALWLRKEMGRRNEVALAGADIDGNVHADVGPRIFVIAEELNSTMDVLRDYWREIREKADPARSPALTSMDSVSFMGRQVRIHIVYIGQALSAKAMGGGRDSTENMGVIAFARTKSRTWKMLAPDFPQPAPDNHVGRMHVVSDRVETAQGIYMTGTEAREFALSGTVSPLPSTMPGAQRATGESHSGEIVVHRVDLRNETASPAAEPLAVSGPVTLREAHKAGMFPDLSMAGLRTRRHRDPGFPTPAGRDGTAELYDVSALAGYADQRKA